jgi:hypothetical protein
MDSPSLATLGAAIVARVAASGVGFATMETRAFYRLCSSCKKELPFGSTYYKCSVSTCNRARMPLTFCSVACFEAHVPVVRHREAWAEEEIAPTREAFAREQAEEAAQGSPASPPSPPRAPEPARAPAMTRAPEAARGFEATRAEPAKERRIVGVGAQPAAGSVELQDSGIPEDILIVASKLKAYVRARSGMNTSDGVMEALSDIVRELCDAAVQRAAADGRKTLMARDF